MSEERAEDPTAGPGSAGGGADADAVVAVGASAGGLEALTEMLSRVDPATGLAFVVVQHLAPDRDSALCALLQSHCRAPVAPIRSGEAVRPGRIHVVPPGRLLRFDGPRMRLLEQREDAYRYRPIDFCFEGLARAHGRSACCVVLSGTGSDGAAGLRAVKAAGGIALAQEGGSARYPAMPEAAAATGMVDLVLPASRIVASLEEIVDHRAGLGGDRRGARLRKRIAGRLPRVAARLHEVTGHDFADYKPGTLVRRIERRMALTRTGDPDAFVRRLEEDADEAARLAQDFLIGVTRFLRDPEAFEALRREVIGPVLDRGGAGVRVWVPGCSTGEEAYTLAILFAEAMEERGHGGTLQVFGTDIDAPALAAARAGIFTPASAAPLGEGRVARFFQPRGGQLQARAELRERCVFAPHNMLQDPPFSRLDLVSCRNLMIYLSGTLQRRALPRFHFALRPSGFLFLGPSEGVAAGERLFETVSKPYRIFRRNDAAPPGYSSLGARPPRARGPRAGDAPAALRPPSPPPAPPLPPEAGEAAAEQAFLRHHAAPFAAVTASGEVRYLSQRMTAFARPSSGTPSTRIDDLLAPELRIPVRTALAAARRSGAPERIEGILARVPGEAPRLFDLSVSAMDQGGEGAEGGEGQYLLALSEVRAIDPSGIKGVLERRAAADQDLAEAENARLRRQLAAVLGEFETSDQELKSTNEELMSMNEELQSSNEEIETSREELQSINEELETVNAELSENNRQVVRANSDLKNLFESTDLPVLFLDRDFCVRNFTPPTAALYGIRARDIGRPIFDLSSRVDYPSLREDAERVDASLQPVEREVRIPPTDETFILRMRPYRTTDDRIDGYVLSFVDITARQRSERALERNREELARRYAELETLYDTTPVGLALIGSDMRYVRINETLAAIDGVPVADYVGRTIQQVMPHLAAEVVPLYEEVFRTGRPRLGVPVDTTLHETGGEMRHFLADFYPIELDGEVYAAGVCVREVTEQRRLVADLQASEARMRRLFDASPMLIVVTEGPDHVCRYANPAHVRLTGREVVGQSLPEALPDAGCTGFYDRFDAAYATGEVQVSPEYEAPPRPGEAEGRWFRHEAHPVLDGAGGVRGVASYAFDITTLVRARHAAERSEAEKTVLMAELQHRVKNTLATVRAISRLLLEGAGDARTFHARLGARLGTLSRTHDLLTRSQWGETTLRDVIAAEAAPYEEAPGARIRVRGDAVPLDPRRTLAFGMAFHELMTNAAKHGALSVDGGWIEVAATAGRDGRPSRITWKERGGPPVEAPGDRRGFGSTVLEKVLGADADAQIRLEFERDGLWFEAVF
ncbi:two-component system CheB/CheR fusion protein [Hasllibacter halocynthiae]|uniref:histidine kinase n=1 Tax=Hasllibacter halocynthiae TaxID=595589 RepID=A0A2T0X1T4_9RHOB|nr:chemotaxis protein CheB [Hasllibacter halocynthiae]PRY92877.1 two-component system CheB/CheR fusion protein [Hasllibacter halocynthiae]